MAKNPPWTLDELILALDLYFRVGRKHEGPDHPEVITLSQNLNKLPIHKARAQLSTFRNPAGVAMKLGNFLARDPQYSGSGLRRGNRLESQIWDQFASKPDDLRRVARAITAGILEASKSPPSDDNEVFPEGEVLSRIHRGRERNQRAIDRKKQQVLQEMGTLACEVCGFDFKVVYGTLGEGFAECHHIVPLSQLPNRKGTRLLDLAILCANCHRMIHKSCPMMGIREFKTLVLSSKATDKSP